MHASFIATIILASSSAVLAAPTAANGNSLLPRYSPMSDPCLEIECAKRDDGGYAHPLAKRCGCDLSPPISEAIARAPSGTEGSALKPRYSPLSDPCLAVECDKRDINGDYSHPLARSCGCGELPLAGAIARAPSSAALLPRYSPLSDPCLASELVCDKRDSNGDYSHPLAKRCGCGVTTITPETAIARAASSTEGTALKPRYSPLSDPCITEMVCAKRDLNGDYSHPLARSCGCTGVLSPVNEAIARAPSGTALLPRYSPLSDPCALDETICAKRDLNGEFTHPLARTCGCGNLLTTEAIAKA